MSFIVNSLKEEVGIQVSHISNGDIDLPIQSNVLMIVDDLPRGRIDKIMSITSSNVNQKLGRKSNSKSLQAVYDALSKGVSKLQILRIVDNIEVELGEILYNNTIKYDGNNNYDN